MAPVGGHSRCSSQYRPSGVSLAPAYPSVVEQGQVLARQRDSGHLVPLHGFLARTASRSYPLEYGLLALVQRTAHASILLPGSLVKGSVLARLRDAGAAVGPQNNEERPLTLTDVGRRLCRSGAVLDHY